MPSLPELPVDLAKDGLPDRTASTPAEYWDLVARGYSLDNLSPQKKAARTRAAKRKQEGDQVEEQKTSHDGPDTTDAGTNQS